MGKKGRGGSAFSWLDTPTAGESRAGDAASSNVVEIPGTNRSGTRRRTRAKTGKRSDPNYVMAGAYVERRVRERVDEALAGLKEPGGKKVEYSDLVQSLLVRWLEEVGYAPGER